jgi:hypothetical protein
VSDPNRNHDDKSGDTNGPDRNIRIPLPPKEALADLMKVPPPPDKKRRGGKPKSETDPLSGWTFDVEEVSNSVYRIRGRDAAGRTVERTGTDPDELMAESRQVARRLARQQ